MIFVITFVLYIFTGLMIYLFYGIDHSLEGKKQEVEKNTIQIKPKI